MVSIYSVSSYSMIEYQFFNIFRVKISVMHNHLHFMFKMDNHFLHCFVRILTTVHEKSVAQNFKQLGFTRYTYMQLPVLKMNA